MASAQPTDKNMKKDKQKDSDLDIEASRLVLPICPYCKQTMETVEVIMAKELDYFWMCKCPELPDAKYRFGD